MIKNTFFLLFLLTSLYCSGCTTIIKPEPPLISAKAEKKISLAIGIYYSPEFSGFTFVRKSGSNTYITEIGESSINLLNQVFSKVFDNVIYVNKLPPYKSASQVVSLIIEPVLEDYDHLLGLEKIVDRKSITYRFNFYNPDGVPESSWMITGNAEKHWWNAPPVWSHVARDMHNVGTKLLSRFILEVEDYQNKKRKALSLTENKETQKKRVQVDIQIVPQATFIRQSPIYLYREVGVIALSVTVTNNKKQDVLINDAYFRLQLGKDRLVSPINSYLFVGRLPDPDGLSSAAQGISGGAASAASKVTSWGSTVSSIFNVMDPVARVLVEANNWNTLQLDARKNVSKIGKKTLKQGESVSGMLFFRPAGCIESFNDVDLIIWMQHPQTRQSFRLVVPVDGVFQKNPSQLKIANDCNLLKGSG